MKKKNTIQSLYNTLEDYQMFVDDAGGYDDNGAGFEQLSQRYAIQEAEPQPIADASKGSQHGERKSVRKLSPFEMSQRLLRKFHIRNMGGALYAYDPPLYAPAKSDRITEMLREVLTTEELSRLGMVDYRGVFEYLLTDSSIKISELPCYPGHVLFENGFVNILNSERINSTPDTICLARVAAKYEWGQTSDTPTFDDFLQTSSGGDVEIQRLILAFLGYCLIPDQGGKCLNCTQQWEKCSGGVRATLGGRQCSIQCFPQRPPQQLCTGSASGQGIEPFHGLECRLFKWSGGQHNKNAHRRRYRDY